LQGEPDQGWMQVRQNNFLLIAGKPILIHTIEVFIKYDPAIEIVVILPEQTSWNMEKSVVAIILLRFPINMYWVAKKGFIQ